MLFCKHEWKVLHTTPIYIVGKGQLVYKNYDMPIGEVVICTCDKCGKIKKFINN